MPANPSSRTRRPNPELDRAIEDYARNVAAGGVGRVKSRNLMTVGAWIGSVVVAALVFGFLFNPLTAILIAASGGVLLLLTRISADLRAIRRLLEDRRDSDS
jgi:hypothetical protein